MYPGKTCPLAYNILYIWRALYHILTVCDIMYTVYGPIKGRIVMEAYCVKCRSKREISNPQAITMKNGKPATSGTCPSCGTKVFRIGASR